MAQLRQQTKVEPIYALSARTEYSSRAMGALLAEIHPDKRYNILDLGPAVPTNLELYSQFASKIYIEDFYRSVSSGELLGETEAETLEKILPFSSGTKFEVILCWDVLNYLSRENLAQFADYLSKFCAPKALLLSMFYTNPEMPGSASCFRVKGMGVNRAVEIVVERGSSSEKPAPRYTQSDIKKYMPQLELLNSYLLRYGFREELFLVG